MNFKEKTVVKILLMVAKFLSPDEKWSNDIQNLANSISAERFDK